MSGKVILAESAGFCYGVKRAVDLAHQTAETYGACRMLGDLMDLPEKYRLSGIDYSFEELLK